MKIIQTRIPKDYPSQDGLDDVNMDHLGQVVLLAGRNGSGKSRLLGKVANTFKNQLTPQKIIQFKREMQQQEAAIISCDQQLLHWNNPSQSSNIQGEQRANNIGQAKGNKKIHANEVKRIKSLLDINFLEIQGDSEERQIIYFVPKKLDLRDPKTLSDNECEQRAKNAHTLGVENLHENVLPKIQELHTQFWHATHQHSQLSASEIEIICNEYERLQSNIEDLLGVRLNNDSRGSATLFGFPIGQANLSEGQRVLLQLAVAIHCQNSQLSNTLLLLDEPENHIHPGAIIEVLETLINNMPDGQIWIATHSVSLLAHFAEQGSLWYMDEGKISPAGKIQEKVLEGLLGDSTRVSRQREFLEKPEKVALTRYAQQCLCPPTTATSHQGDPQTGQIRSAIDSLYEKYGRLRLLDYGAGQGRLLANFLEDSGTSGEIASKLDYVAFDGSLEHQETCKWHICRVYSSSDERWFGSYDNLLVSHNKGSFNLVVMCNVLHEILPSRWESLFGPSGEITELLKDDGHLLIVEDQRIPVGENAHKYGFLVLDTGALKDLFGVHGNAPQILEDSQRDGRLKAHLVSKGHLSNVARPTVNKALQCHKEHCRREIDSIRQNITPADGRLFSFWLVQYANVTMALEEYRE